MAFGPVEDAHGEPIVRVQDLKRMGFESAVITAGAMGSYGYALARYGQGIQAGTVAFTTLTFGQLLHAISCRSDKHSLFSKDKLPPNRYLTVALTGSFAAQALAMTVPGLRSLLGTSPIGLVDGLAIAAGAGLPLLINEATKTIGKDISIHKEIKPIIEAKAEAAP